MAGKTSIEWADAVWNPIVGCSVLTPGCTNCYAMKFAYRFNTMPESPYHGLTTMTKGGPVWTGEVGLVEKALTAPLTWKTPQAIFVNSMGDLFHENAQDEWIDRVFAVMAAAPWHTFLVLTKRHERMRDYVRSLPPPRNVWLGVSVEDQRRAEERIPALLATPAAKRFISAEPLLDAVSLTGWLQPFEGKRSTRPALDWVICGGESGPGARPMKTEWAELLRNQCVLAGAPFFFKQWGGVRKAAAGRELDGREWNERPPLAHETETEAA